MAKRTKQAPKKEPKKAKGGEMKTYLVSGASTLVIDGERLNPGDEFEANLDEDYETQMLMGGHLEILKDRSAAADKALAAESNTAAEPDIE